MTINKSPTLNLILFSKFITTHPAEHPPIGGTVSSPSVQH